MIEAFETLEMAELTRAQASEKMQNIVDGENENFSLKFGVLIGLIKVESVSNKEVVNTILHLVSENLTKFIDFHEYSAGLKFCNNKT